MSDQAQLANFRRAVRAIYESHDNQERVRAEEWLEDWRGQASAWQAAAAILDDSGSSEDERFMAAQTLRTKTQRDFEELPPEAVSGLQNTLVTLLIRYGDGFKPIRTQLCVAIASLAVHIPAATFGEAGVIGWLYNKLNSETDPSVAVVCLLELLLTLPQEVMSTRVAVRPERRRQAEQEMTGVFEAALSALHGALSHSGDVVLQSVLAALAQWLSLTRARGVSCETLQTHPLIRKALDSLGNPAVFDDAVDAVDELIWCTVDRKASFPRIRGEMMPLIQELVGRIMAFRPRFHVALLRAINDDAGKDPDEGLSPEARETAHDDDETVRCMVRLFLDIADAYQVLIAQGSEETVTPLEGCLEICSHPVWDTFTMALGTISKIANRVAECPPTLPECSERIKNFHFRFVSVLGKRVRFADDLEQQKNEARRQFKMIRYEIEDVLRDIVAVLGPTAVLEVLAGQLGEALKSATSPGATASSWKDAEAAYFCMMCLSESPPPHGDQTLLQVLKTVDTCADHERIQFTVCMLICKFSCWLASSALEDPSLVQLVPLLFKHSILSLNKHVSAGGASLAFAALCRDSAPSIAEHCSTELMDTFDSAASIESATWRRRAGSITMSTMPLEEEDVCSIVEGTATVLAHAAASGLQEAEQSLVRCMDKLMQPVALLVQACSAHGGFPPDDKRIHATVTDGTQRLATFCQHLQGCPAFIGAHLPRLWDFVASVISLAQQEEAIVESSLKVIIKAIGSSKGHQAEHWLQRILENLPQAYEQSHFSGYLYLASHIVRACGTEGSPHQPIVANTVTPMIQEACSKLASLGACNRCPHDMDDLFLMAYKGLVHAPSLFLGQAVLSNLLRVAAVGMLVQHQHAFQSIQSFMWRLLDAQTLSSAPNREQTQAILQELLVSYGPTLLRLELAAVVGLVSENRIPDIAGTLLQIMLATSQAGVQWLQEAVAAIPEACATMMDKQSFVQRVGQACNVNAANPPEMEQSVWSVNEALWELSRTCRRTPRVRTLAEKALAPQQLWPDLGLS